MHARIFDLEIEVMSLMKTQYIFYDFAIDNRSHSMLFLCNSWQQVFFQDQDELLGNILDFAEIFD